MPGLNDGYGGYNYVYPTFHQIQHLNGADDFFSDLDGFHDIFIPPPTLSVNVTAESQPSPSSSPLADSWTRRLQRQQQQRQQQRQQQLSNQFLANSYYPDNRPHPLAPTRPSHRRRRTPPVFEMLDDESATTSLTGTTTSSYCLPNPFKFRPFHAIFVEINLAILLGLFVIFLCCYHRK